MKKKLEITVRETHFRIFFALIAGITIAAMSQAASTDKVQHFVQVSPRDPRYFELSDGSPYIPIGLNIICPQWGKNEAEGLAQMDEWMRKLSENRGSFIRIWLSHRFWDIEHAKSGEFDSEKAKRIDSLLEMARRYGVRVKMTLEHFRSFDDTSEFGKPIHHVLQGGPAEDVTDFFTGARSREQFKKKLDWYAQRYGGDPVIFAWELWNEINCVKGQGWEQWTKEMLEELHQRFPNNLATQSLGSFDHADIRSLYRHICPLPGNNVVQVHRYLDLGASLKVCHGPVDLLAADTIREMQVFNLNKPILLAESGAVEPHHSGPFRLYEKDEAGIILHDVLFAPFFAGAAGPGQIWHWDKYVDKQNLWYHYARFAEAVKGLDPPAENFRPAQWPDPHLRIYVLIGKQTLLAWCRDAQNTWHSELQKGKMPEPVCGATLDLDRAGIAADKAKVSIYGPWVDQWIAPNIEDNKVILPDFTRSIVVRVEYDAER